MLKKFLALTFALLMISAQTSAMKFATPAQIGTVSTGGQFGLQITGANKIDAEMKQNVFTKGFAIFDGKLYLHFDDATAADFNAGSYFGSSDAENAVQYYVFEGRTEIIRLDNDAGLELYLLATETGGGGSMSVIGKRDGTWVKFFDTADAQKVYGLTRGFYMKDFSVSDDALNFVYEDPASQEYFTLSYRWDAAAQWFGIEKI